MFKNIRLSKLTVAFALLVVCLLFCFSAASKVSSNASDSSKEKLSVGYAISVDSKTVCILKDLSEAELLSEKLLEKAKRYYKAGDSCSLLNNVEIIKGEYAEKSFSTPEESEISMGVSVLLGKPQVETAEGEIIVISLSEVSFTEAITETEFQTKYEYTYGVSKSYEKVISEGENGTVKQIYETKKIDGETVSQKLILENVVNAPQERVIEVGVTPSMQLASSELAYFIKPYNGIISSPYGYRYLNGYEFHSGIDLVDKKGSCYGDTVVTAADGVVVESGYSSSRGNYVIIEHEYGFSTVYMHFKKRLVSKGDTVSAGDPIGTIGSTGRSTGPHLHFEIRLNGKHTNPENYLSFK